jgi:hypothetical protein
MADSQKPSPIMVKGETTGSVGKGLATTLNGGLKK